MNKLKILFLYIILFEKCILQKLFHFTVIISIYNTGRYFNDSITSLLSQTIGFENIQVILVNDGSSDNSEEICLLYKIFYPKNIVYIKILHGGLSKARNVGIKYSLGKYINYLDPDDKWDKNAFKLVYFFFKFHKNVDIVAGRLKFFEAKNSFHPLDYKFYRTRVVNLSIEYNCTHLSAASSFFRSSFMKNKTFEEKLLPGEDARFINNYLLIKPLMGVIKEALYYYRWRADYSSTIQNQQENVNFYFDSLNFIEYFLINISNSLYNKTVPFLQYLIGYNLISRIKKKSVLNILGKQNFKKYCIIFENLLRHIDDKYIIEQKMASYNYKLLALSKKHKKDKRFDIEFENGSPIYLKNIIINLKKEKNIITWIIININNNIIHLEGIDNFWFTKNNYFYYCKFKEQQYFAKNYYECSNYDFKYLYGLIKKGRIVVFDIPIGIINSTKQLEFYVSYMNMSIEIFPSLGRFTHISTIKNGYYISDKIIIKYINRRLTIYKYKKKLEMKFEKLFCSQLKKMKKENMIKLRSKFNHNKYKFLNYTKKKIWLLNDRRDRAGDNGEFFFRYLKSIKLREIKVYFVIERNSSDFNRLRKFGDILDIDSDKYLNKFLKADKIFTCMSNSWAINPFNKDEIYIRDLLHFEVVFLQHGITKDDVSMNLNRLKKNYSLFVTSSKKEYKSILSKNYGYNPNNVILTGLPRYDNLENMKNIVKAKKIIAIIPTWRSYFLGMRDKITQKSIYSNKFIYTEFFKFYNNLINEKNLLSVMKKNNYTGIFCLHPALSLQYIDFKKNKYFSVIEKCDYQKLLLESSLLITDYSSIFFDFAYLRKPVIYTHFDYEKYRMFHYKEGYFKYSRDGFGPVCKDSKSAIKEIIFEIENHCILRMKYLKNIKKFFTFSDNKNSERLFKKIIINKIKPAKVSKNEIVLFISFILCLIKINSNIKF